MEIYEIPLTPLPNQSFQVSVSELSLNLTIRLKQLSKILVMDLYNDDKVIFLGVNCKANYNLMSPFSYKIPNFVLMFICDNEIFSYLDLGTKAKLCYVV